LLRNVKPPVSEVIERFHDENVTPSGVYEARLDHGVVSKEHARENELQNDLGPHVKHNPNHVVLFLSDKLLLSELIVVVVLVTEQIMNSKKHMRRKNSGYSSDVGRHDRCELPKKSWHKEKKEVIFRFSSVCRMGGCNNFAFAVVIDLGFFGSTSAFGSCCLSNSL